MQKSFYPRKNEVTEKGTYAKGHAYIPYAKKGKTILLLAFLPVMTTLVLTCLSIQSAMETANANIKKALSGYFTVNAKQLATGITEDTVSRILAIDDLSGRHTRRSYSYANYCDSDGNALTINTKDAFSYVSDTSTLISTLIVVVTVVSTVLMILILSMSIRSRKREAGILMAVGIAKPTVLLQYVLEIFLIAAVAFPFAYLTSRQMAGILGTLFGKTAENVPVTPEHFVPVDIPRALEREAPLILADEPTGNLDEDTAQDIAEILKESAHKTNKYVVAVTHSGELTRRATWYFG